MLLSLEPAVNLHSSQHTRSTLWCRQ